MSTVTAGEIIAAALRHLRVIRAGEALAAEDAEDALYALNSMLDVWNLSGTRIYARTTTGFALTALDPTYTIGSGGDFDTTRPADINAEESFIRDSSNYDTPLLPMTEREFNAVTDKSPDTGSYPNRIWYNKKFPLGEINLDPAPQSGLTLYLAMDTPLTVFTDLVTQLSMPPGYQAAIEWNLAVELAADYGKSVTPILAAKALETLAAVESKNAKKVRNNLMIPAGNDGSFDFNKGY